MAAQRDLGERREPAEIETLACGGEEGGLGEVVLGGNGLEDRIIGPCIERAYRGWVAGEDAAGEGVDLIERLSAAERRGQDSSPTCR